MAEVEILEGLNEEQQAAVTHDGGPLLIIAGAGTGKTTVVTRRIANMIRSGAAADEVLALTFTEKAAGEMEERVEALLPIGFLDLWVSTFHAFCERVLKDHALEIGLSNDFTLLSETEQWLLLRRHIEEFDLDYYRPKGNPTKFVQALVSHFSRLKDEDITPEAYLAYAEQLQLDTDAEVSTGPLDGDRQAAADEAKRVLEVAKAYHQYQQLLRQQNAMDFGDLIVETIHLFRERPAVLDRFRKQFKHILVDEFQDTNFAQYDLIKLLAAPDNHLTVVADDDQSIYRFRGASMSNILTFKDDFPESREITLVQNYRSRQQILDLAYDFIQHNNPNRLEESLKINKRLVSNQPGEALVEHLHSQTLDGEARLVRDKILELKAAQPELAWSDFAILVRANDQAQAFLPLLERAGIPYQFLASQGLFAKPVIVDITAFLRLLDQYHESRALYRVLTYPVWSLPANDITKLLHEAQRRSQSLYELLQQVRSVTDLSPATYDVVEKILALVGELSTETRLRSVGEITLKFLEQSGFLQWVTEQPEREATEMVLYLNQFYKYIEAFERAHTDRSVRSFMTEFVALIEAGEEGRLQPNFEDGPDAVKVMTVHAAKGLEFAYVFVVNLVDKRFPTIGRREGIEVPKALLKDLVTTEDWHLQEERRLFYVALTRAKHGVFLTSALDYGGARKKKPSRFLVELGFVDTAPQPTGEVIFGEPATLGQTPAPAEFTRPTPSTFSFTQLVAYETCPWQYRFAFLLKVPVPGKGSFSFGKTIHSTLYEFFRRMKEGSELQQDGLFAESESRPAGQPPSEAELLKIYDEKWINEWFRGQRERDEYYEKGKKALRNFYKLHQSAWPEVQELEAGFQVPLGQFKLKGAIDRVDRVPGGVEILDYKTGRYPKTGKKDMEQLYLYALAMREVFAQDAAKLTYYFIEENRTISEEFDPEKLAAVSDWALGTIAKILEGDFTPTPGFQCRNCDFREICEFRKK